MSNETLNQREDVRELVRQRYGAAALRVLSNQAATCCEAKEECCPPDTQSEASDCCESNRDGNCCSAESASDPISGDLYAETEAALIPEAAILASLGCGNPTALAELKEGEIVLDLGSGGGIDVLLSAKRVGPTGFAFGLDMTDEMLELAEKNRVEAEAENVRFLKGHIEEIPLEDNSVDVVISNCVINLSADKDQVLKEAFRVLLPGGRFAVSDVVVDGELPADVRKDLELYIGCVAGALELREYIEKLTAAGFEEASVTPTRYYNFSTIRGSQGVGDHPELDGKVMGAFIRATKPK